jgi:hypothetical protein
VIAVALVTLVALAGCGSAKPAAAPPSAAPSTSLGASPTATAATSPPGSASPSSAAAGPIDVQDVSFVSAAQGWALGDGELLTTTDGTASWTQLPSPPAAAHIRFASAEVGYAWSAAGTLWITADGGTSWQPGGLTQVVSLETAAGWVWSLAGPQPYPDIWRAPVGSTTWTNLGPTPDRSATLTVHGDVAYVVGQQGAGPIAPSLDVFVGTAPVRHASLPCVQGQTYVPFAPLGVSTDGTAYLVCDVMNNQAGSPTQTQLAYQSPDEGSKWAVDNPAPPQPPQGVTATVGAQFAWNSGPDLYMLSGQSWQIVLSNPGHSFSLVGFETNSQGVAVGTNGYLWITHDGGTSWSRVTVLPKTSLSPSAVLKLCCQLGYGLTPRRRSFVPELGRLGAFRGYPRQRLAGKVQQRQLDVGAHAFSPVKRRRVIGSLADRLVGDVGGKLGASDRQVAVPAAQVAVGWCLRCPAEHRLDQPQPGLQVRAVKLMRPVRGRIVIERAFAPCTHPARVHVIYPGLRRYVVLPARLFGRPQRLFAPDKCPHTGRAGVVVPG